MSYSLHVLLYLGTIYNSISEPGGEARACNLSIWKVEAGELPQVESKLDVNIRPFWDEVEYLSSHRLSETQ